MLILTLNVILAELSHPTPALSLYQYIQIMKNATTSKNRATQALNNNLIAGKDAWKITKITSLPLSPSGKIIK